jgi:hypothetical protein
MLSSHMSGILRERPPRCQTIVSGRNRKTPLRSMSLDVVRAALQGELGEPDHGFLLVCNSDFPFAEGLAVTSSSRAHKPSCKARATVIFATSGEKTDRTGQVCTPGASPVEALASLLSILK